ncbi:hypothetical protein HYFRA_00003091 [Hymenoscyphus fraxineus]|uniref:Peptidase M43 pregnancy-associated plasma-A domain-containing protein n=1 Tax=Hymenoscyphus fraxineus TaxID=746836 RepID=A0A9N9KP25_9HELO|nr:hypothetical protein HYFRA_00003091 [Hymenoscyphus fraxineus]
MQFKSLLLSALAATGALSEVVHRECGTSEPTEEQFNVSLKMAEKEEMARAAGNVTADAISVRVYFHVLASSRSVSGGYLTQATINQQLAVMNTAYAPYAISFTMGGTDWTVNTAYANDQSELAMKRALRKGTYADLNLYFVPNMSYLGYCYFPTTAPSGSTDFYYDGCTIASGTVPGGAETQYNEGQTATHEVGHWFGLYHTFQGGCSGSGDSVSDTPAEASAASGCPIGRDTCSGGGVDPIHNYMDYTVDSCYEEFTAGQSTRMNSFWSQYRAGK